MSDSKRDVVAGVLRLADFVKKEENKRKAAVAHQAVALARYRAERDRYGSYPLSAISVLKNSEDPRALDEAPPAEVVSNQDEFTDVAESSDEVSIDLSSTDSSGAVDRSDTRNHSDTPFSDDVLADFNEEE